MTNEISKDDILRIEHGERAGFFSNCSMRLHWIVRYFNNFKRLPIAVCSKAQFLIYKDEDEEDVSKQFFRDDAAADVLYRHQIDYAQAKQFTNYRLLDLREILPLVRRYFLPAPRIFERVDALVRQYTIDFVNTVGVLYRGNDKSNEIAIASYEEVFTKAKELQTRRANVRFLVQTDEAEFLAEFSSRFPNSFSFKNLPPIPKNKLKVILPSPSGRMDFGVEIFAAVLCLARTSELITGSGNMDMWTVLYRGHTRGVYQYLENRFVERNSVVFGRLVLKLRRNLGRDGASD